MKRKALFVAVVTAALPGLAMAVGESPSPAEGQAHGAPLPAFKQLDKDANGMIDQDDAKGVAGLDFSAVDANGDGRLSVTEYEAAARKTESRSRENR